MSKFEANGFEIDEDDPQVPLSVLLKAVEETQNFFGSLDGGALDNLISSLGIPMHILAETDQK